MYVKTVLRITFTYLPSVSQAKVFACLQPPCVKTHLPCVCSYPTGNDKVNRKETEDGVYLFGSISALSGVYLLWKAASLCGTDI